MRRARRGATFFEATMALALGMALVAGLTQALWLVTQQRRATYYRTLARQEADNVMEAVMRIPWPELTQERLQELELSDFARQRLPDPSLNVATNREAGAAAGQRIRVEIAWQAAAGQRTRPLQLVAWRFPPVPPAEAQP